MKFLHAMLRVSDPQATVIFFQLLGLEERRRRDVPDGKFTLIFLGVPGDEGEVELTHNWGESGYDGGRNFGHLAFRVDARSSNAFVNLSRSPARPMKMKREQPRLLLVASFANMASILAIRPPAPATSKSHPSDPNAVSHAVRTAAHVI